MALRHQLGGLHQIYHAGVSLELWRQHACHHLEKDGFEAGLLPSVLMMPLHPCLDFWVGFLAQHQACARNAPVWFG
jgi:hypothetical protein